MKAPALARTSAFAVALLGAVATAVSGLSEIEKIERLLEAVRTSQVQFIRNGQPHAAEEAERHLRSKWTAAGDSVKTAQDFIERVASGSSLTGLPYGVRLPDGSETTAREWLLARLAEIEQAGSSTPTPAPEPGAQAVLELLEASKLRFLRVESDEIELRTGPEMASHMRLKHALDGGPELSASQFIRRYCTRSFWHGTDYLVRLEDGREARLADWLEQQLQGRPLDPRQTTPDGGKTNR
jgi:hypothetical protein